VSDFLHFQILEKWANLRLPLNVQKPKNVSTSWGFVPDLRSVGKITISHSKLIAKEANVGYTFTTVKHHLFLYGQFIFGHQI